MSGISMSGYIEEKGILKTSLLLKANFLLCNCNEYPQRTSKRILSERIWYLKRSLRAGRALPLGFPRIPRFLPFADPIWVLPNARASQERKGSGVKWKELNHSQTLRQAPSGLNDIHGPIMTRCMPLGPNRCASTVEICSPEVGDSVARALLAARRNTTC